MARPTTLINAGAIVATDQIAGGSEENFERIRAGLSAPPTGAS
jgi:glutaminase